MIGLLIDMDGVIYRDRTPIEGSLEFLKWLEGEGIPYLLVTNNSYYSSDELCERLRRRGIDLKSHRLLTSVNATEAYLRERYGSPMRAFVIGSPGLREAIARLGWELLSEEEVWEEPSRVQVLIVGYDRELTYRKLAAACLALNEGEPDYVATNSDVTFPTSRGLIPGAGSTLHYLKACSGRWPTVIGKPNPLMGEIAIQRLKSEVSSISQLYVVGDRLESDMAFAQALRERMGDLKVISVLVLSGVTEEPPRDPQWPIDLILPKLANLREHVEAYVKG